MDSYKCFCGNEYRYEQMKSHYKECTAFKNQFIEIDNNISKSIKHFVDKISNSAIEEDYVNGLFWLKFLFKRYVNLVGDLIKKSSDKKNFLLNQVQNNINENKSIGINIQSNKSYNPKQLKFPIKGSSLDLTSQYTQGNIAKIKELSDEEDLIQDYCKKVSEKTNDFDESLIKVMSDSISALTSRDCFVMVSKNIKDGNLL